MTKAVATDPDLVLTKEAPVVRFRTAYDPTYDPLEFATVVDPEMPTRTKGYFKDTCDVNKILERYYETGVVEHVQTHGGTYGECTSVDFKEAMDTVTRAQEMFDDLPAKARAEFNNDPAKFLDFASDLTEADVPKLIELEMLETGSITHRNFMEGERRRRELEEAPRGGPSSDPVSEAGGPPEEAQ